MIAAGSHSRARLRSSEGTEAARFNGFNGNMPGLPAAASRRRIRELPAGRFPAGSTAERLLGATALNQLQATKITDGA